MNMKCTQNIYKSANGSSDIAYYLLQPEGVSLRGVVQISHDVCDYFSRYTAFAKFLCGLGYVVCGNDHLGHGASAAKSTDLGFFAVQNGWKYLVDDMLQLTNLMRARFPDLPYFLFGNAMGSLIARIAVPLCPHPLTGVILCGTVGPQPMIQLSIHAADSIVHSKGPTHRSGFLARMTFLRYNRKLHDRRSNFDWVSRDPQTVARMQADEKCNFLLTASAYRDLYSLIQQANAPRCFKKTPHQLSMLFLAGDQDPVSHFGEGLRQTVPLYRAAGVQQIDAILYKDARHDILNEYNRLDVYGDISRWLDAHTSS